MTWLNLSPPGRVIPLAPEPAWNVGGSSGLPDGDL